MKQLTFFILLVLLTSVSGFSQYIVSGAVKDNAGAPVPYSTLRFYSGNNAKDIKTKKIADSVSNYIIIGIIKC